MFNLNGKVALITGATGGIGMSIARKMKQFGVKLILSGTKKNILADLSSELGGDVKTIVTDLSNKDDITFLAKEAEETFGKLDLLVNNAGITALNGFIKYMITTH